MHNYPRKMKAPDVDQHERHQTAYVTTSPSPSWLDFVVNLATGKNCCVGKWVRWITLLVTCFAPHPMRGRDR